MRLSLSVSAASFRKHFCVEENGYANHAGRKRTGSRSAATKPLRSTRLEGQNGGPLVLPGQRYPQTGAYQRAVAAAGRIGQPQPRVPFLGTRLRLEPGSDPPGPFCEPHAHPKNQERQTRPRAGEIRSKGSALCGTGRCSGRLRAVAAQAVSLVTRHPARCVGSDMNEHRFALAERDRLLISSNSDRPDEISLARGGSKPKRSLVWGLQGDCPALFRIGQGAWDQTLGSSQEEA